MNECLNLLFLPRAFHDRVRTFRGGAAFASRENPTCVGQFCLTGPYPSAPSPLGSYFLPILPVLLFGCPG